MSVTPEQLLTEITQLRDKLDNLFSTLRVTPGQVAVLNGLSEISKSLGSISAGEFLALSEGEDPQNANAVGTFISALGRIFNGKTYHIGGVNLGDLKWGANSITGELEAGDGAVVLTQNGISLYDGTTEVGRMGNLNGFLSFSTDVFGIALGDANQYMTYDQANGLKVYGALVSDRELLTADRTYYIATTGSDSNDGLTTATSWLTLQHALDYIADNVDSRGYTITLDLADGTYTSGTTIDVMSVLGDGEIVILGNETTPANVVLDGDGNDSTDNSYMLRVSGVENVTTINGIKFTNGGFGVESSLGSFVKIKNLVLDVTKRGIKAGFNGTIYLTGNLEFTHDMGDGFYITDSSLIRKDRNSTVTITLTDTPAFGGQFVNMSYLSDGRMGGITFTGSATGKRYTVNFNSCLGTDSSGASYFPGDSAGSTATGGQYD